MKQIIANILLLLVACCTGCTPTAPYPLAMQQAESCMNTRPDSALHLLQTLEDSLSSFPEETRMYYHLLCIQAKDKQYINHTDDSLINRIVDFYKNRNEANKLMMAYYYQGSVYRDMNDAPRALKAFLQAVDISTPDNDLLPKAYNQMGSLFMYQGLYDEAIKINRKNIELYTKSGKPNKASFALRDIARMYDKKEMPDSALHYYNRACNTALADKDSARHNGILSEMGAYFYQIGKTDSAKHILLNASRQNNIKNKVHIYFTLAYIYTDLLQLDSARYYYKKTLEYNVLRNNYYSHRSLFALDKRQGKYAQGIKHIEKALQLKDSIDNITQIEAIAKINSLYNYQHTEKENARLIFKREKQKSTILALTLAIIIISLTSAIIYFYQKRKEHQSIERVKKLRKIEAENHVKSLHAIEENKKKIGELNILLQNIQQKSDYLQRELILSQKEKLELRNKEIIITNNEIELRMATFKQSSIYELIQRAATDGITKITIKDWELIQASIDFIYPDFIPHLNELYPKLSTIEAQICYLTKLSIPPTGIARILLRSKSAITNARVRLYKKLTKKEGSGENFDEFVKKL